MTTRSKTADTDEVAAIRELLGDLEQRLSKLGGTGKRELSGASDDIYEFVNDALARIVNRARDSANSLSHSVADKASHLGGDTMKKLADEVERRPLAMLAVAAGIGFLFGLSRR